MSRSPIEWKQVSPLTSDATRLAMAAQGNLANAFSALSANVNNGLGMLIDRYDEIDRKNKAYRTQLALNQLHQADSLEDQQALTNYGVRDVGRMRALLGGEFDEKAYNTALAQWNEGVNNRYLANDALKMSTPDGQNAYRQLMSGIANGNPEEITKQLSNTNLPLSVLGSAASAAHQISQTNLSNQRYEDKLKFDREQLKIAQQRVIEQEKRQEQNASLMALAVSGNIAGYLAHQVGNTLRIYGYTDFSEVAADLKSDNEATRTKAQNALTDLNPNLQKLGLSPNDIGTLTYNSLAGGVLSGKITAQGTDIAYPPVQGSTPAVAPTLTNASGSGQKLNTPVANNSPVKANWDSWISDREKAPAVSPAVAAQVRALVDSASQLGIKLNINDPAVANVDVKGKEYLAARQRFATFNQQQQQQIANNVKQMSTRYSQVMDGVYNNDYKFDAGNGVTIPINDLLNPTLSPQQIKDADRIQDLLLKGYKSQAKELFTNNFSSRDTWGISGTRWVDDAWDTLVQAYNVNGNNPETFKLGYGLLNRFKPNDGNYTGYLTTTSGGKQANTALAGLSNLRKVDVDNYRRNLQRHSSARQLPLQYISELYNPKANDDLDSVIGRFGSPVEKAIFEATKQNTDKGKTTYNSFKELRNAADTFDKHFKLKADRAMAGMAHQPNLLSESDIKTLRKIKINESEWKQLKDRANNGDDDAKELLYRVHRIRVFQNQYN